MAWPQEGPGAVEVAGEGQASVWAAAGDVSYRDAIERAAGGSIGSLLIYHWHGVKEARMRGLSLPILVVLLAGPGLAQDAPKNAPHFVKTLKAPRLEVRYLDFGWNPEAFATLEKGGDNPVGRRSWALARLQLPWNTLKWEGKTIPVGATLLILNPTKGDGPTFEMRKIDMRDVFGDLNVIAEPPPGETLGVVPAAFEKAETTADRLEMTLTDKTQTIELTVHYGDRQAKVVLTR
jgi:hypothetical protein